MLRPLTRIMLAHINNKPRSLPHADCVSAGKTFGIFERRKVIIKIAILSGSGNALA